MHKLIKAVRDVLFPTDLTCDVCGRETYGANICADCAKTLVFNDKETCPVCGRKTVRPEICIECKFRPPRFKRAVSPFVYEDGVTVLVRKFKEGAGYLKEYFADKICGKLRDFPEYDCIVSVPLTPRAQSKRGFNQSGLLAKAVSERVGKPYIRGAVEKHRRTGEQKNLSRKERDRNLAGSFTAAKREEVKGKRVLVVDDVLTTGATADEMAKVLLRAGADTVYLATVASVEYKILRK